MLSAGFPAFPSYTERNHDCVVQMLEVLQEAALQMAELSMLTDAVSRIACFSQLY